MKNNIFSLFFLLCSYAASAQPAIKWQKKYGGNQYDQVLSIQQTTDGGYITVGNTASSDGDVVGNHGGNDFWVVKLTESGGVQWSKTLGGSNNDRPYAIRQTNDGGYIVAGQTTSQDGDVTYNHGGKDCWIIKLTELGIIEWQKSFGGSGNDEAWAIQQVHDGGYIVAGRSNSTDGDVTSNQGSDDIWIIRLSNTGNLLWQKSFGGSSDDMAYQVRQTTDKGFILAAETSSLDGNITENHGNVDYWILKLNEFGELKWEKSFGGIGADIASDVYQTFDGGYIVAGYSGSNNSGDVSGHHGLIDFWVVKLDPSGTMEWQKALGGSNTDWGRAITQQADSSYVVFGATSSIDGDVVDQSEDPDFWLVKLNKTGELDWQKVLGGSQNDIGYAMASTNDNSFVLAGFSWSEDGDLAGSTNQGYSDCWVVKLAPESVPVKDIPASQPLEIYPNPARHFITLKSPVQEAWLKVIISDVSGREILRQTISNGEQINVSTLVPGMYQATLSSSSGIKGTGWFQKL